MTNTMNPNTVVELRDAAIYHANDAFREASFKGHKGVQNLILSDVNLSVYPGEMVYLIGRVGSGKSSLLKTLYAELPLREGYGSVVGFDLRRIRRQGRALSAPPHGHRVSGLPPADGPQRLYEPALRAQGHRLAQRIADPQQDRRGARHGQSPQQGVQDALRALGGDSSVWPLRGRCSTTRR